VVITFVDISERRQVEEALRQSELRLGQQKSLLDLLRDPIAVWDLDGGILEWNRGCEALYGFTRAEALGQHKEQLLATEISGSSFEEVKAQLLRTGKWAGTMQQRRKDGTVVQVGTKLQLEALDGKRVVLESMRPGDEVGA
jgi:two-component system CheB/CheR fusion protein